MKLFAFTGASVPPADYPATLAPTAYLKDFGGLPWIGTPSAGTSNSHTFNEGSATVGASFGAHASADLDGASHYVRDGVDTLADIVSASAFLLQWIIQADTLAASDASPDNEPGLLVDYSAAYFRVTISTNGVRAAIYSGGTTGYVAVTAGTKLCVQAALDGGVLRIRVNGGAWATVASSNIGGLTYHPTIGANYNGSKLFDGRIAQFLAFNSAQGSTIENALYADARANYGVP